MGTEIVKVGARWLDASFARPPADAILRNGYTGIVGYFSRLPSDPKKNMTKKDVEGWLAAGINVLGVWEMSATTANKGREVGKQHGEWAAEDALKMGYPNDVAIIAADDTNTVSLNIDAQEAYMRGFDSTCPNPHGIYGDIDIMARCKDIAALQWVTVSAWAWSSAVSQKDAIAKATAGGAHVLQYKGFALEGQWNVDPNTVIRPFLSWSNNPTPDVIFPPVNTPLQKAKTMIKNKQPIAQQDLDLLKAVGLLEVTDQIDPATGNIKAGGAFWEIMPNGALRHIFDDGVSPGYAEVIGRGGDSQAVELDTAVILTFKKYVPEQVHTSDCRFGPLTISSVPGVATPT
jgi:Domain of unknown function (DUF1906).